MLALLTVLLASTVPAHAYGINDCAATRMGSNLGCTAGDVSITGIAVAPGSPTSCVGGTSFTVDLDITVNFAVPDRWDIGIFLSHDGKDPQTLPASGGASSCSVGILPTSNPFLDLDPNGGTDTCGDGNGAINGGTGSGVVRLEDVPVLCQAIDLSGGGLYIPFVVSWDNQASPSGATCASIADPVPNTVSKCNAPKTTNAVEVLYGTVNAVVLPSITKTDGKTSVNPGDASTYTVVIKNTTGVLLNNAVFTDPVVPNLTVTSVACSTTDATCPAPAAVTVANMQGGGITIPQMPIDGSVTFTINATVANPIVPAYSHLITNTAYVTVGPIGPAPPANRKSNSATDSDTINGAVYSDLSTSTKSVVDLNGGEANPGDVLRYTITLKESAGLIAANGISVTDDIPTYTSNLTVVSRPTGSINASTPTKLDISGITIVPSGTETIVFDVTIDAGTPAGTRIDNIATVTNPGGPDGTPPPPPVTVSPSAVALTNNKKLYLYGSSPYKMSRALPAAPQSSVTIAKGASATWNGNWDGTAAVPLRLDNTISSAYASLLLSGDDSARKAEARLYCSSSATAYASSGEYSLSPPASPTQYNFNLTNLVGGFSFPATCTAGNYWQLMLLNSSGGNNTSITVIPINGADYSRVNLSSSNVIYVNSLDFYTAAYLPPPPGGGTVVTSVAPNTHVYIRSVISDPFGSFDITSARIDITDPAGNPVVANAAMTMVYDSNAATRTYEYDFLVPVGATSGNWTVKVTAHEGSEGTVSDDLTSAFSVAAPKFTFLKYSQVEYDPINNASSPKPIPGADVLYTLQISNSGLGSAGNLYFTDPIPPQAKLFVGNLGQGGPVLYSDPDSDSGFTAPPPLPFTLDYYSNAACSSSTTPAPDADSFDTNIRCLGINMTGAMSGAVAPVTPDFSLTFRVRIQ